MIRGLYTSALGMTVQQNNMNVLSNNIANADTTGFKRDISVNQSFTQELMKRLHDPEGMSQETIVNVPWMEQHDVGVGGVSLGVFTSEVWTDFSAGRYVLTSGKLDLAIDDTPRDDLGTNGISVGFFTVNARDAQGNAVEKYTRDGGFTLNQDRVLCTKEGNTVAGVNGQTIQFPDAYAGIVIRDDGAVYASIAGNDATDIQYQYLDNLRITSFGNLESLRKTGDNLYQTTDATVVAPFTGGVIQGYLEGSNIAPVREMVNMITVQRAYEANARAITAQDGTLQRAVNDVGRR